MHILITGAKGQLAREVITVLKPIKSLTLHCFEKTNLDITNYSQLKSIIERIQPQILLNLAAYTQVETAELQKELCYATNCKSVTYMAELTRKNHIQLIHISSNYVFNSNNFKLFRETDMTQPINYYGLTKMEGEAAILKENPQAIIIRTSSLFSSFKTNNFVTKIITQILNQKTISVVNSSFTQPTSCRALALFMKDLILRQNVQGIIHFTGEEIYSWYEYAKLIYHSVRHYHANVNTKIIPITLFSDSVTRPQYALLDNQLRKMLNFSYHLSLHQELDILIKNLKL